MFEKVGKQFQTFARVAGRWEQENGFMVGKAVFGAQVGSFSGLREEAFRICGGGATWILSGGTPYSPTSSRRIIWECAIISLAVA